MTAISDSVKGYLVIVLIYISLIISGVERCVVCLLAICMSSSEKRLFTFFDLTELLIPVPSPVLSVSINGIIVNSGMSFLLLV